MVHRPQSPAVRPSSVRKVPAASILTAPATSPKVDVRKYLSCRARNLLIIAIAIAICAIALSLYPQKENDMPFESTLSHARSLTFQTVIAAPGRVEAASGLRDLSFDIPGKVRRVLVEQGQTVAAGQLVAELENDHLAAEREAARAGLAEAQARHAIMDRDLGANLVRAEQEVVRLKAELALLVAGPRTEQVEAARMAAASAEAEALQAVEEQQRYFDSSSKYDNWPKQLYDQAHRRADAAAGKRDAARAYLRELQAGSRIEERERAKALLAGAEAELGRQQSTRQFQLDASLAQLSRAKANLDHAEAELKRTRLTSPIAGVVIWKFFHGGEVIDAIQQRPVISVADLSRLRIRASVDEADYPRVLQGQRVKITADAFGETCFYGRVEMVGSAAGEKPFGTGDAREKIDVRVIETIIRLDDLTPLKLGLRVTAFFEAAR